MGSNGIFSLSPDVVKFKGFETFKTHTIRVRLVNLSKHPQRVHVLPPTTSYFKVKYNYKGTISEDVYIQFTPDEYKYYYDCVRIHCEGENLLIPIHAYPVINN